VINQIPITKAILPNIQINLWIISNKGEPEINNKDNPKILKILTRSNNAKENNKDNILFLKFILGVARLRIKRR
jgi:hypothetical protein